MILSFGIYNLPWYILLIHNTYTQIRNEIGYNDERRDWAFLTDTHIVGISDLMYLYFYGNVSVSPIRNVDENGNYKDDYYVSMLIWFYADGTYEYGVSIIDNANADNDDDIMGYEIMCDSSTNPVTDLDEETQRIYDSYYDEIIAIFQLADDIWDSIPFEIN